MKERTVIVTAGASGIGLAIARHFIEAGDVVHICDVDAQAIANFRDAHPGTTATVGSVANVADVDRIFADLPTPHLDVLVNNAGIAGPTAAVEDIEPADWQATIDVDLTGPFLMMRRASPRLHSGGVVINIASTAALFGYPNRSPYAAAKWGLVGLTKTWAMELGPRGIRVNAICPGSVSGPRIDGVIERDAAERGVTPGEVRDIYQQQTSMRLFVDAEDIAGMAGFLASEAGRYVSGQVIGVDGHTESLSVP